jgi:hypothetical protein
MAGTPLTSKVAHPVPQHPLLPVQALVPVRLQPLMMQAVQHLLQNPVLQLRQRLAVLPALATETC